MTTLPDAPEIRSALAIPTTFETRDDTEKFQISGYFAVFNSAYALAPGCNEFVDPHAFDGALDADIRALVNHDTALVLGRTAANTLRLRVDSHGLCGEIDINRRDIDALNLYYRVQRGDVSQCSFGFEILDEETRWKDNGDMDFIIKKVRLHEVSVVTFPAYLETNVSARSAQADALRKSRLDAKRTALLERLRRADIRNDILSK